MIQLVLSLICAGVAGNMKESPAKARNRRLSQSFIKRG